MMGSGRLQAFFSFLFAWAWFLFAKMVASSAANGLSSGELNQLVSRCMLLFLLLLGYWGMGYAFQRQRQPLSAMGLVKRSTSLEEFGTGSAFGWGMMVLCVLPVALIGGLSITFWSGPRQWGLLLLDLLVLLVASLAEEVFFRGYPFQRLIEAAGPFPATLLMAGGFAFIHLSNPDTTFASTTVTFIAGLLLAMAYLRTRALWLPWGLHFAWNASMGLLFGLPISGQSFSPVIVSNAHGPLWLTGDGYGPEGGMVAAIVLLIGIAVLVRITGDYSYRYAQRVVVPGGIPVDIDEAAQRQHEAAMASPAEAPAPKLVQILPVAAPVLPLPETEDQGSGTRD